MNVKPDIRHRGEVGREQIRDDRITGVRKIAVLRANALGDFLFTLPALEALQQSYPQAQIVYLGQAWHASFLNGRSGPVGRAVAIPFSKGVRDDGRTPYASAAELGAFFEEMAAERFDLALQMHGGGRYSNPFLKRLGARVNVGLRAHDAIALDRWLPYVVYQPEIIRYLELVALVGARPVTLRPRVSVIKADVEESLGIVPHSNAPLVLLHPGATDARRRWPAEKFAAVGDLLASEGMRVIVAGVEAERPVTEAVVAQMAHEAQNACGQLTLGALAGLLSRCKLAVCNDSGPMHLAMAVGTPTVGIFWIPNMLTADPLWRSLHRPQVSFEVACPVCGANCVEGDCGHRESMVAGVTVDQVVEAARELARENLRAPQP